MTVDQAYHYFLWLQSHKHVIPRKAFEHARDMLTTSWDMMTFATLYRRNYR
jgi:hypothetical protein